MTTANAPLTAPIWKPIATAPRDGTAVLVSSKKDYSPYTACYRSPVRGENQYYVGVDDSWRNERGNTVHPSHWMELPPPPVDD